MKDITKVAIARLRYYRAHADRYEELFREEIKQLEEFGEYKVGNRYIVAIATYDGIEHREAMCVGVAYRVGQFFIRVKTKGSDGHWMDKLIFAVKPEDIISTL